MGTTAQVIVMGYCISARSAITNPQKDRCHDQLRPDNRFCPVCGSQNTSKEPQVIHGLCSQTGSPSYDENWEVVLPQLGRFTCVQVGDTVLVVVSLLSCEVPCDHSTTGTQCRKVIGMKKAIASRTEAQEVVAAAGLQWDEEKF